MLIYFADYIHLSVLLQLDRVSWWSHAISGRFINGQIVLQKKNPHSWLDIQLLFPMEENLHLIRQVVWSILVVLGYSVLEISKTISPIFYLSHPKKYNWATLLIPCIWHEQYQKVFDRYCVTFLCLWWVFSLNRENANHLIWTFYLIVSIFQQFLFNWISLIIEWGNCSSNSIN